MKRVFAFLLLSSMLMLSVFIYTVTYILQCIVKMIGKIIDGLFGRLDKVNEYSVNSIDSPGE